MRPRRPWTTAEVAALTARYPRERACDIARDLGRPVHQVYGKAGHLGLSKDAAFLASRASGRLVRGDGRGGVSRFRPGHVPANKGLRRPGWFRGRMRETQFKKGAKPHTWQPVGTEVLRDGYVWVKVRDDLRPARRNWISKHQHCWEQAHGPLPAGHIVRFRDGTRRVALDNLECVSRAEHGATKGLNALPREIVQVHQLRGAITRQINKRRPPVPKKRTGRPPKRKP